MMDAVFISDLHLHPDDEALSHRFNSFVKWASTQVQSVYILGDFFHVWPGDDGLDAWSEGIAAQLAWLHQQGVALYFMPGNRDFLVGPRFAAEACLTLLQEPTRIILGETHVLLVHGDRYCTRDRGHQWLRRLTRNAWFTPLFLSLPYSIRKKWVNQVRQHSQENRHKSAEQMAVVPSSMIRHMQQHDVCMVIHGHTHQPGLTKHEVNGVSYQQYVLSDWDDKPLLMCYDKSKGFYFDLLLEDL